MKNFNLSDFGMILVLVYLIFSKPSHLDPDVLTHSNHILVSFQFKESDLELNAESYDGKHVPRLFLIQ